MIELIGYYSMHFVIGLGFATVVAGCVSIASKINRLAASAGGVESILLSVARYLFGLLCATPIAASWMYILLDFKASVAGLVFLALGVLAGICFFWHLWQRRTSVK